MASGFGFPRPRSTQMLSQRPGGPVMSATSAVRSPIAAPGIGSSGGYGNGGVRTVPAPGATTTSGGFPTPSSGGSQYSAEMDPNMKSVLDTMMERFKQAYATNPNLAARLSDDTTKSLITRATGQISDEARGAEGRAQAIEAKGGPAANARAIQEAAARRSAGVTTDITNERAKAKDTLAVADAGLESTWGQGQNALLGAAGGMAGQAANNQIQQIATQEAAQQNAWTQLQQVLAMSMAPGMTAPMNGTPRYGTAPGSLFG